MLPQCDTFSFPFHYWPEEIDYYKQYVLIEIYLVEDLEDLGVTPAFLFNS
jgi:hypothetical protein